MSFGQNIIGPVVALLSQHLDQIRALCRKHGIKKLELFGSAARDDFDPTRSDIDFFFEFDTDPTSLADRFFGLMEDLESLLGCKVDLVSSQDVRNPYFLQVANRDRMTLYAA
jgi:predicted nucleotidyltransferase